VGDVAAGEAQDFDFGQFAVRWFSGDQGAKGAHCTIYAETYKIKHFNIYLKKVFEEI
jgi:hypothetical protein